MEEKSREKRKNSKEVLGFCIVLIIAIMAAIGNHAASEAATAISALQAQYPSGSTWNSSYKNKAWQCHGFACLLADKLTDTDPYTWRRSGSLDALKAGDIVRFNRPHSILVTGVSGNTVTYVDCNWVAKNTIRWGQTIQKSGLTGKFGSLSAVWVCPKNIGAAAGINNNAAAGAGRQQIPAILDVKINWIGKDGVSFSYKVNNGTLSKIHIESVLTGQAKEITYTSGLGGIAYTFDRRDFPLGGSQYKIYLYAYSGNPGHYANEQLHKMRYGSAVDLVTFPGLMSNDQFKRIIFNARWYADMYGDLKAVFGYDEAVLWNHFVHFGSSEGRVANPGFSGPYYMKNHADVAKAYGAKNYALAAYHYGTYGLYENRSGSPVFQAGYYLDHNRDVANAFGSKNYVQAAIHFSVYGLKEQRNSSVFYYGAWYRSHNADLKNLDSSSLIRHYYQSGIKEKRAANEGRKIPKM